ncbi:hypothetical protein [Sporosarcina newyorkensis]|nr:hypothetical protein [Sporosarcina newyorkensis]
MKQTIVMILLALFLVGCEQNEIEKTEEKDPLVVDEEVLSVKTLKTSEENLRFVAGWLDDMNIAYVDHHDAEDRLQVFNLKTGEIHTIYTDASIISEVLIHRSKKQLLVKTSDTSTEANMTVIDTEGQVLDELTVESSELEIQWNDAEASKLLISAFREDWSYQVFLYDMNEKSLEPIELTDPFPQWMGEDQLVYLEGSTIVKESLQTSERSELVSEVNSFHASSEQLVVEIPDEEQTRFTVLDANGEEKHTWQAEHSSETIEDVEFIDDDNIIMSTNLSSDNQEGMSTMVQVIDGEAIKRYDPEVEGGLLNCSPDGGACLVGYRMDTLIDLQTGKTTQWLQVDEEESVIETAEAITEE